MRVRINLFDLIVVGFIALIISFMYINIVSGGRLSKIITDVPEKEYVLIDVILPEDLTWMKKHIAVGDIVQGSRYRDLTATVLEIKEAVPPGQNKRLVVKIEATVEKDELGSLTFGKHPLRMGEEIPFFTPEYRFYAKIIDFTMTGEMLTLKD